MTHALTAAQQRIFQILTVTALAVIALYGVAFGVAMIKALWTVDAGGISRLSNKLPTWDFTNIWMGGRLAADGGLQNLFEPVRYRAALTSAFGPMPHESEWSYPPTMLLVGRALAEMPLAAAYWTWAAGTLGLLLAVLRAGGLGWIRCCALAVSPAIFTNLIFGQNAAWSTGLLVGGLLAIERRPALAGLCFALLTTKPHLGMLAPVCLIAAGRWPAFGWSVAFGLIVIAATFLLFGVQSWELFLTQTRPLMQGILEAPFGQGYQVHAITVFAFVRSLGGDLEAAYAAQAAAAAVAMAITWRLWRTPDADPLMRICATCLLTLFATPYGWIYDAVPLALAVVLLAGRLRSPAALAIGAPPLALLWFWPYLNRGVTIAAYPLASFVILAAAVACAWAAVRGRDAVAANGHAADPQLHGARLEC